MYIGTNLDLGLNELQNVVMHGVSSLPANPVEGQIVYLKTSHALYTYNGDSWEEVGDVYELPIASASVLGGIKIGTGLSIDADGKVSVNADSAAIEWDNILNIPEDDINNVQPDWDETDDTAYSFIKNKPDIPETAEDVNAIPTSEKGAANGVATLDANGKVPAAQLPSYVDDVVDGTYVDETTFNDLDDNPVTPEAGKIYVDVDTLKVYRWSGTVYVQVNGGLTLGTTASTAFRGDYGQIAYDHSQITSGNPHGTKFEDLDDVEITAEDLNSLPDTVAEIQETIAATNPLEVSEETFEATEKTKTITVGGTIFSVMVYDSVTNEQVIIDVTFNATRKSATLSVGTAPPNDLKVVIAFIPDVVSGGGGDEEGTRRRRATSTSTTRTMQKTSNVQPKPPVRRAKVRR